MQDIGAVDDLQRLAHVVVGDEDADPARLQIMHQRAALFPDGRGGTRQIANQDALLSSYPGFIAGKTGFTNLARKTYVAMAQRNGRRLVAVLMYSHGDLEGQARSVLDWGFSLA